MLQKQSININFSKGLDQKTDPWQVAPGNFLMLRNSVFTKGGLLQKRNGFGPLAPLPASSPLYTNTFSGNLTTFSGNLTTIGNLTTYDNSTVPPTLISSNNSINAYNSDSAAWVSKGVIQPMSVETLPLIRNSITQIQCDSVVASNGLVCTVYTETNGSSTYYKYAIADSVTGQNIVAPTVIPVTSGTVTGSPRVFIFASSFVIVFTNIITAVAHLQYIVISSVNPSSATVAQDLISAYIPATTLSWDCVVANNTFYVAYNTTTGGQSVQVTYMTPTSIYLIAPSNIVTPVILNGNIATMMSLCADQTIPGSPVIYVNFYDSASSTGYSAPFDSQLNPMHAATEVISAETVLNIASAAQSGTCTVFYEVDHNYSYDAAIPTHYIRAIDVTSAGATSNLRTVIRSVGLASKAFVIDGIKYFLAEYQSAYQPTYFLINGTSSTQASPVISAKLAYSNGGGPYAAGVAYLPLGLPNVTITDSVAQIAYLYKDLITSVNKDTNVAAGTQVAGIYSQTGINLSSFTINTQSIDFAEIGNDLHISGGFLWMYDGYLPVEHNFFVWPDNVEVANSVTSGSMSAQKYFYQVVYSWTDNQGNAFRSAPSIPVSITLTSATAVDVNIPTLRLTYKVPNPVKIEIYRWSTAQQIYYQVTSITTATLNSTTADSITFTDTLSDATILGNSIIYTTGGVVEDVNAPATNIMALFDTRLWLVDAEDPNLLWFSKQVIESTPVEMSDLFTIYVAPTTAAQGNTGPMTALAPMDDKLIIFKRNAIYYINGTGPDNTGSNSQYSQPISITSTVGCRRQHSIVFTPAGLMFESDKGIWLLSRDLNTQYIGAPVEQFNSGVVKSAVNIPATNQVRFTLDTGETLMYDYYFGQWGTFVGLPAISSCLFEDLHTCINSRGQVFQETPGLYLDGSNPVLLSFTTSWLNMAGLQGYERFYDFYLLGTYLSPHSLAVSVSYDYLPSPLHQTIITPANYVAPWGGDPNWGQSTPWGGPGNLEQFRIHTQIQTCQSFQITVQEQFNQAFNAIPGAGFTLSGINCRLGMKKSVRPIKATNTIG